MPAYALAPAKLARAAARAGLLAALLVAPGCTSTPAPRGPPPLRDVELHPTHHLTVYDGFGSGDYPEGDGPHAWANLDPQRDLVASWVVPEDASPLYDPTEWNSAVEMPASDLGIRVDTYPETRDLEEATASLSTGDRAVLEWLPPDPAALVLYFHGASYDHDQLRSNAGAYIAHLLINMDFAVVAMDSTAASTAGSGGWNDDPTDPENADLAAVTELVTALRDDGSIAADTPIVAMGMSSGGQFAHAVGLALPASVVVAYCAPGRASTLEATQAPTAWFLAESDSVFPTAEDDAAGLAAGLEARGIPNYRFVHPATKLYDQRFMRVAGVDEPTSAAIADDIRAGGFVDEDDLWLAAGAVVNATLESSALAALSDAQREAIAAEIEVMAADHELYDDYASKMVELLRQLL